MELDESVEREELVCGLLLGDNEEVEDDEPSPLERATHAPAKPVMPVTQSVIMSTKKSAFPGTDSPLPAATATATATTATVYREPTVVVVNNSVQRSSVASPSTATASSLTAPMSPKSSGGGGGGGGGSTGARLSFVNERTGSTHSKTNSTSTDKTIKPRKLQRDPDTAPPSLLPPRPPPPATLSSPNSTKQPHSKNLSSGSSSDLRFSDRGLKHHSFLLSEVPDVRHMEQALLGLLDDFHSGKLRAFGAGTMDQMTNIREQQERLAKLHFELGGPFLGQQNMSEEETPGGHESEAATAQENMTRLVRQLEQLSVSIEGLHSEQ